MNKSNIEAGQAGTKDQQSTTVDNQQVSQPNANTNVVGSLFKTREIKFRAWDKFNNKMLIPCTELQIKLPQDDFFDADVDWMQFVGCTDKNGKEIYEGDIVHYDTEDGIVRAKVVFALSEEENLNISGFVFEFICHEDYLNEDEGVDLEVIGNIYENPELLPMPY